MDLKQISFRTFTIRELCSSELGIMKVHDPDDVCSVMIGVLYHIGKRSIKAYIKDVQNMVDVLLTELKGDDEVEETV